MFGKLFMAACMWLFLPIVYVSMRNNTVPKKNLILSVTLPPEGQKDPEVLAYCEAFKKKLLQVCVVLTAALLPALLMPSMSVSCLWSMTWLPAAMFVIMWFYGKGYKGLRQIKTRRGWIIPTAGHAVADLKLKPVKLPKRLKTGWFVPPMILSLLPLMSCVLDDWSAWSNLLTITAISNFSICTLSLVFYGLIFRQKKDVLDEDTAVTEALTRVRRYNWTKTWVLISWVTALYSLTVWFCQGNMTAYFVWTMIYVAAIVAVTLITEFAARHAQQRLTQGREIRPVVDEDEYWIWGQFYYNPNSSRVMMSERVGMGMSMNYARPAGKVMAVVTVLVLLSLPVMGIWLVTEENAAAVYTLTPEQVTVERLGTSYTIEREEIRSVALLEELPSAARIWGTGMPNLLKGSFSVDGYGSCTLCLDPTQPPFLVVDTDHETYILGFSGVEALYTQLAKP